MEKALPPSLREVARRQAGRRELSDSPSHGFRRASPLKEGAKDISIFIIEAKNLQCNLQCNGKGGLFDLKTEIIPAIMALR